ncbi:DENN/MADD domain containing 2D S homeolog [Xenopus laevis]|uniref:DENN/MADD domain containing 2D S homeolog n=1 Tax=Xenopus laevis TaxID=8355 RepID=Q6DF82_XENLA|nr:DENN/MADD domain containing 2D S homeolog [Xenopus laevis]AAH76860.1 MGC84588 protein [Xenopus laevis]
MDHLAGVIRRSFRRKSNKGVSGNTNGNPASEDSSIPDDCKTLVLSGGQSFFEYLVVVSLKKNCDGCYAPQITYQFPKMNLQRENILNFRKDEEERLLNAIPLFCFPDGNNWAPLREYKSETFSFVLTNIDSSRKFGYCRRLLPAGNGSRSPEVYCIISSLGCFGLFSKILDEVEKRRAISTALVYPFMQGLREATFPAPGKTVKIKSFIPESGTEMIELTRPLDCRLEHIDFNTLMQCLKSQIILVIFASVVLERRIVFVASDLRILSECIHAVVALLYPFAWEHTYIPVLPHVLIDTVSCPAPFIVGVQNQFLSSILDQPMEEVLLVDLCEGKLIQKVGDEEEILPPKLKEQIRIFLDDYQQITKKSPEEINGAVSKTFMQFFVQVMGHYTSHLKESNGGKFTFEEKAFSKAVRSKTIRKFLKQFVKTQMFSIFIEAQLNKSTQNGYFQQKVKEFNEQKKTERK